jgi:molybdopterin converting factor small subunit
MLMEIKVLFFGVLAEVTQTMFRHYRDVISYKDLINRIQDEYPEMVHYNYRIAVNSEIVNEEPELRNMDEVAFMPPFAGG